MHIKFGKLMLFCAVFKYVSFRNKSDMVLANRIKKENVLGVGKSSLVQISSLTPQRTFMPSASALY